MSSQSEPPPGPPPDTLVDPIADRRQILRAVVEGGFEGASRQSHGLVLRLLHMSLPPDDLLRRPFDTDGALSALSYEGYPPIAYLGFAIGAGAADAQAKAQFAERLRSMIERDGTSLSALIADDAALLGVADGLSSLEGEASGDLAVGLANAASAASGMGRLRALALDLIEPRGRLSVRVGTDSLNAATTDLALRRPWPRAYESVPPLANDERVRLLARVVSEPAPGPGDLERASAWLVALDSLVSEAASGAVPTTRDVVRLLNRTQGAMKRWVWEEKPRRSATAPARWLIDNEYHVQDFLYAVLYPLFGAEVLEEQYIKGFGFTQPRYDLSIEDLSLIIEVKFARTKKDFNKFEEQIAGDLGLYFGPQSPYEALVAYVYDDCNTHYPELYDAFRDALLKRDDRIVDVVVVRRPSMIPSRSARG